jgi:AraC-like DNA-binding protein
MHPQQEFSQQGFPVSAPPKIIEKIHHSYTQWDLTAPKNSQFCGEIKSWNLGNIILADYKLGPSHGIRHGAMLNKSHDKNKFVFLELVEKGRLIGRHENAPIELKATDMFLWNPLGQAEYEVIEPLHKIIVMLPKQTIEDKLSLSARDISHHILTSKTGTGALLADFMRSLLVRVNKAHPSEMEAISNMTATLIADVFQLQSENEIEHQSKYILRKVCKYIQNNLSNPDLKPAFIAEENQISVRYLQQLFSDMGTSISKWIKEQRLIRCRHEILKSHGTIPITSIAYQMGFDDPANFSRSFKAYFGKTPSEIKKEELNNHLYKHPPAKKVL